jgi:hypothetical protein
VHCGRSGIERDAVALLLAAQGVFASSAACAQSSAPAAAPASSLFPSDSSTPPPEEHAPRVTLQDHERVELLPSGHAALGIGGAVGSPNPGFRVGLDASLGITLGSDSDRAGAWTLAPSVVTGFGKYPTYVMLDFGRVFFASEGQFGALMGALATVGPAVRVDSNVGAGGELSLRIYLLVFQVGVRAITIVTDGPELQIQGTLGLGLF